MIRALLICATFISYTTDAFACVGKAMDIAVEFAADSSSDGALALKRTIDGKVKEELLDDTGYLGARLAASLMVTSGESSIESSKYTNEIAFLRQRLKKLGKSVEGIGIDISKEIADVESAASVRPFISRTQLETAWGALEKKLRDKGVNISAKTRTGSSGPWSKTETSLKEFTLPFPTTAVARGVGCGGSKFSSFTAPRGASAPAAPQGMKMQFGKGTP